MLLRQDALHSKNKPIPFQHPDRHISRRLPRKDHTSERWASRLCCAVNGRDGQPCSPSCSQQGYVRRLFQGASATTIGATSTSGRALADAADTIQAGSQLIQKDTVISVAFGTAILALGAVTIGVIYLSVLSWNDKRVEKAERDSFEQALRDRESRAAEDSSRPIKKGRRRKELVAQGEKKGFGR